MTVKEIKLGHIATFGNDEDSNAAMKELKQINPTYHWCPDWDFMAICDTDAEYNCCTCEKNKLMKVKLTNGKFFINNKDVYIVMFRDGSNLLFPTHDNDELEIESDHSYNEITVVGDKKIM